MKENSIENLQNKEYFKNIDEAVKVYEEFRRYKDNGFIKSIDPEFFFNLTDMLLSDYKRVLKMNEVLLKENEELKNEVMEKGLEIIGIEEHTKADMEEIIEQYYTANEDCISVQKVKDKIEEMQNIVNELSQEIEKELKSEDICREYIRDKRRELGLANRDIKFLQELLERE